MLPSLALVEHRRSRIRQILSSHNFLHIFLGLVLFSWGRWGVVLALCCCILLYNSFLQPIELCFLFLFPDALAWSWGSWCHLSIFLKSFLQLLCIILSLDLIAVFLLIYRLYTCILSIQLYLQLLSLTFESFHQVFKYLHLCNQLSSHILVSLNFLLLHFLNLQHFSLQFCKHIHILLLSSSYFR